MINGKKIYPKMSRDKGGLKFHWNSNERHYTMRFSGNPLYLLEYSFNNKGGKNFMETFEDVKARKPTPFQQILIEAIKETESFLSILAACSDNGKSPIVIYENEIY